MGKASECHDEDEDEDDNKSPKEDNISKEKTSADEKSYMMCSDPSSTTASAHVILNTAQLSSSAATTVDNNDSSSNNNNKNNRKLAPNKKDEKRQQTILQQKQENTRASSPLSVSSVQRRSSSRKRTPSFKIRDTAKQSKQQKKEAPQKQSPPKKRIRRKLSVERNKNPNGNNDDHYETNLNPCQEKQKVAEGEEANTIDHWIQCDKCFKWRLLPPSSTTPQHQHHHQQQNHTHTGKKESKEEDNNKWYCSMNINSNKNKCSDSEDDWTDKEINDDADKNKTKKEIKKKKQRQKHQQQKQQYLLRKHRYKLRQEQYQRSNFFIHKNKNNNTPTMAELAAMQEIQEQEDQDQDSIQDGTKNRFTTGGKRRKSRHRCGVGSRYAHKLKTSSLRRIREIFWDDDLMYHYDRCDEIDKETTTTVTNSSDCNDENQKGEHDNSESKRENNGDNDNDQKPKTRKGNENNAGNESNGDLSSSSLLSSYESICSLPPIRMMLNYGQRFQLKKVHDSPHIYIIENFLTPNELSHLDSKIQTAESKRSFQRSFVDGTEVHDESGNSNSKGSCDGNSNTQNCSELEQQLNAPKYEPQPTQSAPKGKGDIKESSGDDVLTLPASTLANEEHSSLDSGSKNVSPVQQKKASTRKTANHRPRRVEYHKKQRTSTFIHFSKLSDTKIASIERRAAELLGLPHHCIEPLQIVRYANGQYFSDHHDMGALFEDGSVELPPRSMLSPPRRIVTIFVYLNDLPHIECGGCTRFPLLHPMDDGINIKAENSLENEPDFIDNESRLEGPLGCFASTENRDSEGSCQSSLKGKRESTSQTVLDIYPKRGRAVLWCNIDRDGMPDERMVHAGQPVFNVPSKSPTAVILPKGEKNHHASSTQQQVSIINVVKKETENVNFEQKNGQEIPHAVHPVSSPSPVGAEESTIPNEHLSETVSSGEKSQGIADSKPIKNSMNIQHSMEQSTTAENNRHKNNSKNKLLRNGTPSKRQKKVRLPSVVKYGMNIWACEE